MKPSPLLLLALPLAGGLAWLLLDSGSSPVDSAGPLAPLDAAAPPEPDGRSAGEADPPGGQPVEDEPASAVPALAPGPLPSAGIGAEWLQRNDAGIEALERGDAAVAVGLFEACVEAFPDEPVFARNLAIALDALARKLQTSDLLAEREQSLELLERAMGLLSGDDPATVQLRSNQGERLARWRASGAAEATMLDDGHVHFALSYDGDSPGLRESAPWILESLEDSYHEFGEHFGRFPVEEGRGRIRVVLMDREQFDSATGLGDWAGGAFDGTVRIPVERVQGDSARRRLAKVLRHELCHAFVRLVGGGAVPGWLNEGLSQRLELDSPGRRSSALQLARAQLQGFELYTLDKLQGSLAAWDNAEEIGRAYAQSLALVDWIERQYGLREVVEMVLDCGEGKTPDASLRGRIGLGLDTVLEDLAQDL